ncbi:TPA: hypothetical protein ACH3X3_003588 [Trebouxia sp. C0006]
MHNSPLNAAAASTQECIIQAHTKVILRIALALIGQCLAQPSWHIASCPLATERFLDNTVCLILQSCVQCSCMCQPLFVSCSTSDIVKHMHNFAVCFCHLSS